MHILFLTHYFPPEVNAPASRTFEHAKYWATQGVAVTVVTNHPHHPKGIVFEGYRNRWLVREEQQGIRVRRVKTFVAANSAVVRRTVNYLWFCVAAIFGSLGVKKPSLVIATSPQFFCAVAGYVVSRIKRAPFVFELRDLWPESIVTVGAMRSTRVVRAIEKLELFLYRRAALIVALTESFRDNLVSRGISRSKIVVVRNGVDLEFFSPGERPRELAHRLGVEDKFVVAYIGTIGMAHSVETIVGAADLLRNEPGIVILIVGEGARKTAVEQLVALKRLHNVKVLSGVGKAEVRDYYALADLNLVTLRNRPLFRTVIPSKIFEIMAMARPIVSTVDGETRRILDQAGAAEFCEPDDAAQLARTILALRDQPARLRAMASAGRRFVERNCRREGMAAELLSHLQGITQSAPRDAAQQGCNRAGESITTERVRLVGEVPHLK